MNPKHLKRLIEETLAELPEKYRTEEAVDLLMLTAAQESHLGEHLYQVGGGPALGIFQVEPDTYSDLVVNYLKYGKDSTATDVFFEFVGGIKTTKIGLSGNIPFQIIVCRLQYWRQPEPLPVKTSYGEEYEYIEALARYWKKYWNTSAGKGTVGEAIANYHKYVH